MVKPGFAQVAGQVLVFPQARIAVGGEHLGVGVDEHIRSLHLLQELIQGVHIMAGDQDAVALDRSRPHLGGRGLAELLDVRPLEKLHGPDIHLPCLHR